MPEISLSFAIIAGFLTFFSACLIPIIPTYIAYLSGVSLSEFDSKLKGKKITRLRLKLFLNSIFFIIGFSSIFILLGIAASSLGQFLIGQRLLLEKLAGLLMIILGLYTLGFLNISFFNKQFRVKVSKNFTPYQFVNSGLIGAAFALGWTPCIGPILASILFLASLTDTMWQGAYLLFLFSLGMAVPFLVISLVLSYSLKILPKINSHIKKIKIISGSIIILMGILLLLGKWNNLFAFFLKLFS